MSHNPPVIIAAVDQSDMLEAVVARARHLAECQNGTLIVLHVIPEKGSSLFNASYGDLVIGGIDEKAVEIEEQVRLDLIPRLESVGVKASALQLVTGTPAKAVQEQLEHSGADMLVVGQPKARLGSVATNMAKNAVCDVYIVRVQ